MHRFPRFPLRHAIVVLLVCGFVFVGTPRFAIAAPARDRDLAPAVEAPPPGYEWKSRADKGMVMGTFFGAVVGGLIAFSIDDGRRLLDPVPDSPGSVGLALPDDDDATTARILAITSFTLVGAVMGRLIGAQSRVLVPVAADARAVDAAMVALRERPVRFATGDPQP